MLIDRSILQSVKEKLLGEPLVVVIYGPRQAGKTTLINQIQSDLKLPALYYSGDDIRTQEFFSLPNLRHLESGIKTNTKLLVIDEAQKVPNIGTSIKLLFDSKPRHIILSGSSSFDLAGKINEPLTGRSTSFTLYPLSILEIPNDSFGHKPPLEEVLRFGLYPKVVTLKTETEKQDYLNDLLNNYLYRDILSFENVRKPKKVVDLLTLLSLQIGNEVSIAELASNLSISKLIVEKYLDIMEKMFLIINLRGFSRNLRKEISKTSKYYFIDLGLRNLLARNFNPLSVRSDTGFLFENYCIIEKIKALENSRERANLFFWRTYDQQEIDLIKESDGNLNAFEFKYSPSKKSRSGKAFLESYPNSTLKTISPENHLEFLKSF